MLKMNDIEQIITRRSAPGILIFNENSEVLFSNAESSDLLCARPSLDEEARTLCDRLKASSAIGPGKQLTAFCGGGPPPDCAIRAFMLGGPDDKTERHIVVLLEKVADRRNVDIESAKAKFSLSKRETEVLVLVHQGLSNKALSNRLFISEQTVKDHIRHIMRKTGVNSRVALIAALR